MLTNGFKTDRIVIDHDGSNPRIQHESEQTSTMQYRLLNWSCQMTFYCYLRHIFDFNHSWMFRFGWSMTAILLLIGRVLML
jgi:hypothetical protein